MSATEKEPRKRRKPARHRDVVMALIEERVLILRAGPFPTKPTLEGEMADAALFCDISAGRLVELLDELKRAFGGKEKEDEE